MQGHRQIGEGGRAYGAGALARLRLQRLGCTGSLPGPTAAFAAAEDRVPGMRIVPAPPFRASLDFLGAQRWISNTYGSGSVAPSETSTGSTWRGSCSSPPPSIAT